MSTGEYIPWMPRKDERVYAPETVALFDAIKANDVGLARELISKGAPLDEIGPRGHRPLSWAAQLGHIDVLRELIAAGANIDSTAVDGTAAIHCARDAKTIDALIDAGADVDTLTSTTKSTPLNSASGGAALPIVKALIRRGAEVNSPDVHGVTPLIAAATNLNLPALRELISAGAQIDLQDKQGSTALLLTCNGADRKRAVVVEALIAAGANVNFVRSGVGDTPLLFACREGNPGVTDALLRSGANVNHRDCFEQTPLTTVIREAPKDRHSVAKLLLQAGADLEPRISERHPDRACRGKNARELAADKRDKKMLALLDDFEKQ